MPAQNVSTELAGWQTDTGDAEDCLCVSLEVGLEEIRSGSVGIARVTADGEDFVLVLTGTPAADVGSMASNSTKRSTIATAVQSAAESVT